MPSVRRFNRTRHGQPRKRGRLSETHFRPPDDVGPVGM